MISIGPAHAKRPKVIVERPAADSTQAPVESADAPYQHRVDSLNQAMYDQIEAAIKKLEKKFDDPKTEEEVGRIIGAIVMEKQLALLDVELDRAVSVRDTLLIIGLQYGLNELLRQSPQLRETLRQQIEALELKFQEAESSPPVKR